MTAAFWRLWPRPRALATLTALHVVRSVLHGLLLAALVPIFRALLRPEPDFATAAPWLLAGVIGALAYIVVSLATSPATFAATTELSAQLRHRVMDHATTLPMGWFDSKNKGRLSRTVTTAATTVTHLAVLFGPATITGIIVPAIVITVSFAVDWRVGTVLLVVAPLAYLARQRGARVTARADVAMERVAEEIGTRSIELGRAQPILRATGHATTGTAAMARAIDEHEQTYRAGMRRVQLPDILFRTTVAAGLLVALVVGTSLMLEGHLPVPDAVALFVLTVRFAETLGEIGAMGPITNAADRVRRILNERPLPRATAPVREIESPDIDLVDVGFSYGTTTALTDVTLHFPAGSTTAVVGPSGSGKTTLTHLIARFFDPDTGHVRIGGVDVRDIDPDVLMREIAVVFQDVYLFDDTIEANVRLARPDATADELAEAAAAARLDEVVERLPAGWQTRVGEAGAQLSGGERQRVSIARALLKSARIVLVDEASSALDPENEAAVSRAIGALGTDANRTVIVIAHRPTTLATANSITVLDDGHVIQTGAPRDLLVGDGTFARLYRQYERARAWHINHQPAEESSTRC